MKTADFLRQYDACREGAKWALSVSSKLDNPFKKGALKLVLISTPPELDQAMIARPEM